MEAQKENYNKRAKLISLWKSKSIDLAKSAIALVEINEKEGFLIHQRTPLMLMGMALESLIKGYIISKEESLIVKGKFPNALKTHSLLNLFKKAEISINKEYEEKVFLQRLSEQIDWMGRYPVPISAEILEHTKHGSKKAWIFNENDKQYFLNLYNKVDEKY